jgi:transcriptional regulator with XRE-family HTH domain
MDAPSRLRAYLTFKGWSQTDFAREIGHHQTHVGRLLLGKRGPGLELAHAIERLSSDWPDGPIRMEEWIASDTQESAPPLPVIDHAIAEMTAAIEGASLELSDPPSQPSRDPAEIVAIAVAIAGSGRAA